MGRTIRGRWALSAALALGLAANTALAADPSYDELKQQVEQLKTRLDQVESKQDNGLTSAQVDATVERVINDAQKRSQLLQMEGFTAGYNKGKFLLQSADGNYVLHPYVQFQLRDVSTYRQDAKNGGTSDDFENGFEIRRAKFGFDGNAFSPDLTFQFQWQTSRTTGTPALEDAWVQYKFNDQMALQFGQFKGPLFREGLVSSMRQLAAERSLLNALMEGGDNYLQGVNLIYDMSKTVKVQLAFTDGFNSNNTSFQDPGTNSFDFGVGGRVDWQLMGEGFKSYNDFTAMGNKEDLLVVGAAFDWSQNGDRDQILHTVDAQWEPASIAGLAVSGAYVGRYTRIGTTGPGVSDNTYDWGVLAQAGYMLNDKWEVFARYDLTEFDQDTVGPGVEKSFSETSIGVNYYMYQQNAKVTLDLNYLCNGSPSDQTGQGILQSDKGEYFVRAQFQLIL